MRSRISQSLDLEESLMLFSKERKVYNLNALKKQTKGISKIRDIFIGKVLPVVISFAVELGLFFCCYMEMSKT